MVRRPDRLGDQHDRARILCPADLLPGLAAQVGARWDPPVAACTTALAPVHGIRDAAIDHHADRGERFAAKSDVN
jgi:hypothetical protein